MEFIKTITQKVSDFLANCEALDLVILGVIILIPILAIVFAAASKSYANQQIKRAGFDLDMRGRRRRMAQSRGYRPSGKRRGRRRGGRRYPMGYPSYSARREFRVHYIEPLAHRNATRKESMAGQTPVVKVRSKMDQGTLLATGIFGLGVGLMVHRAAKDDRNFR